MPAGVSFVHSVAHEDAASPQLGSFSFTLSALLVVHCSTVPDILRCLLLSLQEIFNAHRALGASLPFRVVRRCRLEANQHTILGGGTNLKVGQVAMTRLVKLI